MGSEEMVGIRYKAVIAVICLLTLLLAGCKTTYVPSIQKEYIYSKDTLIKRDSIHVLDSVFMTMRGDTVFKERFRTIYKDIYINKVKIDTISKIDSITYVVTKEKELTTFQKVRMGAGDTVLVIILVIVGYSIVKRLYKLS